MQEGRLISTRENQSFHFSDRYVVSKVSKAVVALNRSSAIKGCNWMRGLRVSKKAYEDGNSKGRVNKENSQSDEQFERWLQKFP